MCVLFWCSDWGNKKPTTAGLCPFSSSYGSLKISSPSLKCHWMLGCPLQHAGPVKPLTGVVALLQLLSRVKPAGHCCSLRVSQESSCRFVVSHQNRGGCCLSPDGDEGSGTPLSWGETAELGLVSLERTERESHQSVQISPRCDNRMAPDFLVSPVTGEVAAIN